MIVEGDCNDYVGKGLSGGKIIVKPSPESSILSDENTIIGTHCFIWCNIWKIVCLRTGRRKICVRNSGSHAIVEGCGAHGCEYMTGGTAIIIGPVGDNFGAGMTGGMAFVYDEKNEFENFANPTSIIWQSIETDYWKKFLKERIEEFESKTSSKKS